MERMSLYQTRLEDRTVLRIGGEDRQSFLQQLLTQNVDAATPDSCTMTALLTPQGKLAFDFLLFTQADGFFIDCDASVAADLLKKLAMYKLRARVEIEQTELQVHVIWQEDGYPCPSCHGFVTDPRHEGLGLRGVFEAPPSLSLPTASAADWQHNRIRHGVAQGPSELPPGSVFPLEYGLAEMSGVDFQKGCFVGQEVTSRTHRKGKLRKKLRPILFADLAPARGAIIENDQRQCGEIIAASGHHALALIREDVEPDMLVCETQSFTYLPGLFG
jgi:folate-binding protein YgfZ